MSDAPPRRLVVLDDGPHHVVVWKDANTVVVAGRGAPRPTLLDRVQEELARGALPVHRLDRGTTGACVFAKTPFGQQALSDAFRRHLVDKRYLAVVEGEPSFDKLTIDARLLRKDDPNAKRGPLAWQVVDPTGQRALTRVQVLGRRAGLALVLARPETGRMHQIRAHLAHLGHPIVGDALYGSTRPLEPHVTALHAWMISFPYPHGGRGFVVAPPSPSVLTLVREHALVDDERLAQEVARFTKARDDDGAAPRGRSAPAAGQRTAKAKTAPRGGPSPRRDVEERQRHSGRATARTEKTPEERARRTSDEPRGRGRGREGPARGRPTTERPRRGRPRR